jgi:chaperonin GroEL
MLSSTGRVFQNVSFGSEALGDMQRGAEILYKAVKSTMGPSGHNVIIENGMSAPLITKDGVTVAKSINLREKLPSIGAELLKEIAAKTNELSGDGPQPLYSKVLTPTGFITMGEIKEGMEICGTNGSIQTVLGVYPKGKKEICKIYFTDGNTETRTVECSEDHLWAVKTYYGHAQILTTKQMLESGLRRKTMGGKYFIQPTEAQYADNSDQLPLDPYLLGVLLGDGSLSQNYGIEIAVGLNQSYILNGITLPANCTLRRRVYPDKHYIKASICGSVQKNVNPKEKKSIIKKILADLGLLGTNSHTKFIPKMYLYSSVENRKKLLKGLLDTDGHISDRGLFQFSTVSEQLFNDFIELSRSLGKQIYCKTQARKTDDGSYSEKPIHKVCELKGNRYGLKISRIEKTGKYTEMRCIKVSNDDHLYITNDFVPTHNTTTATVLGYAMLSRGIKMIATGVSSIALKRGMDYATSSVIAWLKEEAIKVRNNEDIINVGTISANGDRKIGELLCEAINKVGQDGIITIEHAKNVQTTLEVVEGMQVDSGYTSPFFVTNQEKLTCELNEPLVLITNKKLTSLQDMLPALELANQQAKPLLIIGDEIDGEVLHTLIVNKMKGVLFSCTIKAPGYGDNRADLLSDIGLVTGGTVFDASSGVSLKNIKAEDFGTCKKVVVGRNFTTFIGDGAEGVKTAIDERVSQIRTILSSDAAMDDLRRSNLKKRLAKLAGGIAVVKVGGSTEVEILEKKDRVEDALNATVAAVQEGILPGGGVALFYAAEALEKVLSANKDKLTDEELAGARIICDSCKQPLRVIVENTGKSADVVMNKLSHRKPKTKVTSEIVTDNIVVTVEEKDHLRYGYDAYRHEYCDMIEVGIIDPVMVERYGLEHANSVIGLLLTCNAFVSNEEEQEETD